MLPTYVQSKRALANAGNASVTVSSFTQPLTPGALVILAGWAQASTPSLAITDNATSHLTYTVIDQRAGSALAAYVQMWWALVPATDLPTSFTLTQGDGTPTNAKAVMFLEVSGTHLTTPVDVYGQAEDGTAGTSPDSLVSLVTTGVDRFLVSAWATESAVSFTAGTDWTCPVTASGRLTMEYRDASTAGTYTNPITYSASVKSLSVAAALQPPADTTPTLNARAGEVQVGYSDLAG